MSYELWMCPVCHRQVSMVPGGGMRVHSRTGEPQDPQCPGTGYSVFLDHAQQMAARGLDKDGKELKTDEEDPEIAHFARTMATPGSVLAPRTD